MGFIKIGKGSSQQIGGDEQLTNGRGFNGNITDLRVYNRVLSQDEVTKLYNQKTVKDGLVLNIPLQAGKDNDSMVSAKNFTYGEV